MKLNILTYLGVATLVAGTALAPITAHADDQKNKNMWRNGAIGGGAAALYGLHNHDKTTTILGLGAAAYSAKRYEDDRHHQSQRQAARDSQARYHRTHRHYTHAKKHR